MIGLGAELRHCRQYGWTANQCYRYYRTYHEDRWLLKGLVGLEYVSSKAEP